MSLEAYKSFCLVAKYGSITKASEKLFITQPALSRSIKQLELELGCTLLYRTSKGVKLTQEGEVLYHYLDQAFGFISTAEKKINDMKNLLSGEVRIGVSDTICKYYLVPYLKLFNTFFPHIKIQVLCQTTPGIIKLLKSGKIDFGIINLPYSDEYLEFKSILEIQDCFVVGQKYKQLCSQMQHVSNIVKYPMILLEKASNSRNYIDKYFIDNSISVKPDFELGNIDLLVQFAKYDFGVACVIRNFIEDELEKGRLFEVKPIEKISPRSIGVTWLKNVPLSKASNELINILDYTEYEEL